MLQMTLHPFLVFGIAFCIMWGASWIGWSLLRRRYAFDEQIRGDFGIVLTASLTLLGLIISFTFSIAANRYDQRKNYEEAEANAIGTEYLRADLLPAADAARVRSLLKGYLQERIRYYEILDEQLLREIGTRTSKLQTELWGAILPYAHAEPNTVTALVVSGMNDVLNSQGYTHAAWIYRIPTAAWLLMMVIAVGCNMLIGFGSHAGTHAMRLLPILPLLVAIAFMLIADIDAPRRGIIRVIPLNLESLAESLGPN
jgi:hypothetical protein